LSIRVQNVYYLLCYAWDYLEERSLVDLHAVTGDRVENLLGQVLRDGVSRLFRRGLDRGYVVIEEDGRRLRGKVLISETAQRLLLNQGRVICLPDELTVDVPHNRVIKAGITALVGIPTLDKGVCRGLLDLRRRLGDVTDVDLTPTAFRTIQLHRNVAGYGFLLNVCQLIARSFLPEAGTGRRRFHPFVANEQEMGALFQAFVRNFLKREQADFEVSAPKVDWDVVPFREADLAWLPAMQTDIVLESRDQKIVIEAKYYATPHQAFHGARKLISGHLYQVLTYVSHLRVEPGQERTAVLLYAGAGQEQRLEYRLGGHRVLVRGLDLSVEWREVHRQLLGLARELRKSSARILADGKTDGLPGQTSRPHLL
jgi:5-methylcytosine-specific restriction enzyme subunit McrC